MQAGEKLLFVIALLVLKDNVRKPNSLAWNTDNINAIIFRFVPGKTVISPLLWMTFAREVVNKHNQGLKKGKMNLNTKKYYKQLCKLQKHKYERRENSQSRSTRWL